MSRLKLAAVDGDPEAALAVAMHFEAIESDPPFAETERWLEVGAENGAPAAMQHLAVFLYTEGGLLNCRRALFWLSQAAGRLSVLTPEERAALHLEETRESIQADRERCSG